MTQGTQTKVEIYSNRNAMKRGIKHMERHGWRVLSVQSIPQGWGCLKTLVLGCLFLPLALLGRKPEKFQVTFQK